MNSDLVHIIEATYQLELDEATWLRGVVDAAAPFLNRSRGMAGWVYDASDPHHLQLGAVALDGVPTGVDEALLRQAHTLVDANMVRQGYLSRVCGFAGDIPGVAEMGIFPRLTASFGISDAYMLNGNDASDRGCLLACLLPKRTRPAHLGALNRIATHIATAMRLRRRLGDAGPTGGLDGATEAVLTPSGRVEHLEGEACTPVLKAELERSVSRIERARGKLRRTSPDDAVDQWKGLVAARWSLVDSFERDGKRFIVARRNEQQAKSIAGLSEREAQVIRLAQLGHSNKLIAYELGISSSTVGVLLWRASQKLGVKGRRQLMAALGNPDKDIAAGR